MERQEPSGWSVCAGDGSRVIGPVAWLGETATVAYAAHGLRTEGEAAAHARLIAAAPDLAAACVELLGALKARDTLALVGAMSAAREALTKAGRP